MKKIRCQECGGYGYRTEYTENSVSARVCSTCNGKGQMWVPQTNADRIRAMSDEELAAKLYQFNNLECAIPFCQDLPECSALLETDAGIPEEKCTKCLLAWLQQPAEDTPT